MRPLPYVWPYALVFWSVFVWAFIPEFQIVQRARRSARREDSQDSGSVRVIMLGMWLAFAVAFPLSSVARLRFPPALNAAAFAAGLAFLIGGSLLRRHCWRTLGSSFTGDVQARADQAVITTGAYAFVRHPSYTAGVMMNTSVGLALGSWGSALLLAAASVAVYIYRMNVEERALLAAIGEPYRAFMSSRKRLVPFVY